MTPADPDLIALRAGGTVALAQIFARHKDRLRLAVDCRMSRRLRGRVDVDDVLQESFLVASRRLHEFLDNPAVSSFVWLRRLVLQSLVDAHRFHLGAKMRDVKLEVFQVDGLSNSSISMLGFLAGDLTSPSRAFMKAEATTQIQAALESLEEMDREVLALRHFEELTNNEVAEALGLSTTAASMRYTRALQRLKRRVIARDAELET